MESSVGFEVGKILYFEVECGWSLCKEIEVENRIISLVDEVNRGLEANIEGFDLSLVDDVLGRLVVCFFV